MASSSSNPACKHLVLDAGPLLSLSSLRGLAENFYTVPQVLDELKDKRAREHFEKLGLVAGVSIQVQEPDAASLAHVIQWAKKTGDYAVLSHADLCVLALTYALESREKAKQNVAESTSTAATVEESAQASASTEHGPTDLEEENDDHPDDTPAPSEDSTARPSHSHQKDLDAEDSPAENDDHKAEQEPLNVELHKIDDETDLQQQVQSLSIAPDVPSSSTSAASPETSNPEPLATQQLKSSPIYDDPSNEDDGEGEWITPSNIALHKSRALDLLPSAAARKKGKEKQEQIPVGCMTADFAMQNVLLQMGLGLVGVEGKRIDRVKSWVLRCHACFKICKDSSRKFCPSCGNPTLLRTSVTISSPNATGDTPTLEVHLKKNFQYKLRGTVYSIPAPKPGSAKAGAGEGLILREDQTAWMRAKKRADNKREREERRLLSAASRGAAIGEGGAVLGSWMDPDWVPGIMSTGAGGKGRSVKARGMDGDMPVIGYGKKNPNERRKNK